MLLKEAISHEVYLATFFCVFRGRLWFISAMQPPAAKQVVACRELCVLWLLGLEISGLDLCVDRLQLLLRMEDRRFCKREGKKSVLVALRFSEFDGFVFFQILSFLYRRAVGPFLSRGYYLADAFLRSRSSGGVVLLHVSGHVLFDGHLSERVETCT